MPTGTGQDVSPSSLSANLRPNDPPLVAMRRAHMEKLRLCDDLEGIADALPHTVDRVQCLRVASRLTPLLRNAHQVEETSIFPAFDAARGTPNLSPTRRLQTEHVEDECFADEVTEALLAIARSGAVINAEATGFMLRGFFESVRRHVAFEAELVAGPLVALGEACATSDTSPCEPEGGTDREGR